MKKRLIHIYTLTIRLCAPAFTLSALSALGAMLVLLAGCIHQYPDDGQAADVTLRVQLRKYTFGYFVSIRFYETQQVPRILEY